MLLSDDAATSRPRLVPEGDLTAADHAAINALLLAAFPQYHAEFGASSWYGPFPEYRLWLETPDGAIVAHLGFGRRVIAVGDADVLIAGVGGVATHPARQGEGHGRRLMATLRATLRTTVPVSFGYLSCREAVEGFYVRAGWHRTVRDVREQHPITGEWATYCGPIMLMPALLPLAAWPATGPIDLRGPWW